MSGAGFFRQAGWNQPGAALDRGVLSFSCVEIYRADLEASTSLHVLNVPMYPLLILFLIVPAAGLLLEAVEVWKKLPVEKVAQVVAGEDPVVIDLAILILRRGPCLPARTEIPRGFLGRRTFATLRWPPKNRIHPLSKGKDFTGLMSENPPEVAVSEDGSRGSNAIGTGGPDTPDPHERLFAFLESGARRRVTLIKTP